MGKAIGKTLDKTLDNTGGGEGCSKMAAPDGRTPQAKTLYIGRRVTIKGAVVMCDTVAVDGELEGDLQVRNLRVGATGAVTGRVRVARNAEIAGRVFDRIEVKGLLIMRAGGRLEGNISFATLSMERGARINGELSLVDYRTNMQSLYRASQQPTQPPAPQASTPSAQQDTRPGTVAAPLKRLDLSALDEMPGPIAATG